MPGHEEPAAVDLFAGFAIQSAAALPAMFIPLLQPSAWIAWIACGQRTQGRISLAQPVNLVRSKSVGWASRLNGRGCVRRERHGCGGLRPSAVFRLRREHAPRRQTCGYCGRGMKESLRVRSLISSLHEGLGSGVYVSVSDQMQESADSPDFPGRPRPILTIESRRSPQLEPAIGRLPLILALHTTEAPGLILVGIGI